MNINEQRVREFAHQIWESEGCPEGQSHRHWEMACRLAEESEDMPQAEQVSSKKQQAAPQQQQAASQQQQAAPQHQTVAHNDSDTINKPKKDKAKALKKTEAASKNKNKGAKFGMDSVNQNLTDRPGNTAMEGLPEPQSGPEKLSFAKADGDKPARRKKAKLLKDVIDTEVSPVNSGIQPV